MPSWVDSDEPARERWRGFAARHGSISRPLRPTTLLVLAALSWGGDGCVTGGSAANRVVDTAGAIGTTPLSYPRPWAPPGRYVRDDGDKDNDDALRHPLNSEADAVILFREFGARASAPVTAAVAQVVKDYYVASAAQDGKRACSLLSLNLRQSLAASAGGNGSDAAGACAVALSPLLERQRRRLLADDVPTMTVTSIHAHDGLGVASLGFRHAPESEIAVRLEHSEWKVDALFDGLMP